MRIFWYFSKEIISTTAVVLVIFLLIFVSTQLAIYLNKMAMGQLDPQLLLEILGIISATLVGMLLPMAFFIALLLTYGRLYAESEMTALFACGMSRRRLLFYTLIIAAGITITVAYLSLFAAPQLAVYQSKLLGSQARQTIIKTIIPGRFSTIDGGKKIFYVEDVSRDSKRLKNIFIAERNLQTNYSQAGKARPVDSYHLPWDIILAKSGGYTLGSNSESDYLVIDQGNRYIGSAGEKNFVLIQYDTYAAKLPTIQQLPSNPDDRSVVSSSQLWQDYSSNIKSAIELQWRIAIPLQTFILALLAVPLSRTAPRQGRYTPLFAAILIYLVYANCLFVARNWLMKGFININIGLWWIHLLLLLLAWYLYIGRPGSGWNIRNKFADAIRQLRH